jgi:hypothetical protein
MLNVPLPVIDDGPGESSSEMLRTEGAVEDRLRKMKEMFEASLVGLGSGSTSRRGRGDRDTSIDRRAPLQLVVGTGSGNGEYPGSQASQGSQEVVGRMEFDGYARGGRESNRRYDAQS